MKKKRKIQHKYKKRRFSKIHFILSIFLILSCGFAALVFYEVSSTEAADDWFETSAINRLEISLPKDDGPHQTAMESWSFKGHLRSESGNLFSFYHTVFLINDLVSQLVSHASLDDHQTGARYTDQQKTVNNSSVNIENRFEFIQGNWLMVGGNGNDRLKIDTEDFSFNLSTVGTRAPMFHGGNGIVSLDGSNDSYYYTRPRMGVSGTVTIGETTEKVAGISWFDHQWGDSTVGQLSNDGFGLQLKDGTDVVIYQWRDNSNRSLRYAGSISQKGVTETLSDADLTIVPREKWTSNQSNITYPIEWTIDIPKKNISVTVQSVNKRNEFDATLTSYNIYWKGPVKVKGSHTGVGFMELYRPDKRN